MDELEARAAGAVEADITPPPDVASAPSAGDDSMLSDEYAIDFGQNIADRSTEFAKAYELRSPGYSHLYALVFDRLFPLRIKAMNAMKADNHQGAIHIESRGKITHPSTGEELFAVVLTKPKGVRLIDLVRQHGAYKEKEVTRFFMRQLIDALATYTNAGIAHGCINPHHIYYDEDESRVILGEPISTYCGYGQMPAFEDLDDLITDPAGKGQYNTASDYFAVGMTLLFLLSGRIPFQKSTRDEVTEWRLERGSDTAIISRLISSDDSAFSRRTEALLKGLLTDDREARWQQSELVGWFNMEDVMSPSTKICLETSSHFSFNGQEYHSTKRLAHHLYKQWPVALRGLRIADLARWLSIAVKRPDTAEMLEQLAPAEGSQKVALSDEKLARIIIALDPTGPIRYKTVSGNIRGLGSLLVDIYRNEEQERLQHFSTVITSGMMHYWINKQEDPDDYTFSTLGWSPIRARRIVRKSGFGFGMERMMYELNPEMSCQSKLIYPSYALTVSEVFMALERIDESEHTEKDPIDRHLAAYIARHIGLNEEITVRPMRAFPFISQNPYVLALGLLTVAKRQHSVQALPNLTKWMFIKIEPIIERLHSNTIKADLKKELDTAVKKGALDKLFGAIVSPLYIKKDIAGFQQAQKRYVKIERDIRELTGGSGLRGRAYRGGLKAAAYVSYSVLALTIFFVIFTA